MTLSRRAARRTALFLLYQWDLTGQPLGTNYEGEVDEFARGLARGGRERTRTSWTHGSRRSPATGRRGSSAPWSGTSSASASTSSRGTVPLEVVIDEAVTLAKRYASEDAGRLVNGILGAIARTAT